MGIVSIYYIISGIALDYVGSDGRFRGNASMDTIAFGHLGTTITILALSLLYQSDIRLWHKVLSIFSIIFGLFITIAAGSRGAIVALFVCFLSYLYINGHKLKILIGLPILIALLFALIPILNDVLSSFGNHALERLYASIYDQSSLSSGVTSGRNLLYAQAIENIKNSPFLGSSLFINGEYVHNSILETFMGLGIFGGILFVIVIANALISSFSLAKNKKYLFVSLLFIQYFTYSLFSRTLILLPLFWLSMYLVIYLKIADNESNCNNPML